MSKQQDRSFIDKCIKDEKGNTVLFQRPNLPIIVWGVTTIASKITNGNIYDFFSLAAFGTLFTWAWLELFQGVNYLRRILGLVVLVATVYGRLQ